MKIEVFKDKLIKALNIAEKVTRKNVNLPILSNVLLSAKKNFLEITATNLESSVVWAILSKTEEDGKVCLSASFLRGVLDYLREEVVNLKTKGVDLVIENKNQKTVIRGVNPEDFPIIPKIQTIEPIVFKNEDLKEGLEQLVNIPSFNQIRPEISGIYFSFKKESLKIASTDSFRLGEKTIKLPEKTKKEASFILPQAAARELLGISSIKTGEVRVYHNKNQVLFEWLAEENPYPEVKFLSNLIEGEYPNYQEIIPKKYKLEVTLNKEEFQTQIKKASLFSGKVSEVNLTIDPNKKGVKISSYNPDSGETESEIGLEVVKGEEVVSISFNYRFLLDGLLDIKTPKVSLLFSEEKEGPAVVKGVGDNSFIYILMPIKAS
jgi:DNA polymerase-3 subunit beta